MLFLHAPLLGCRIWTSAPLYHCSFFVESLKVQMDQVGSGQIRLDLRAAQRSLVADTSLCCVLAGWLAGWHTGARCTLSSSWGAGTAHDNSRGGRKRPAASGQCRAVGAPDRRHRERRRRSASAPHATRQLLVMGATCPNAVLAKNSFTTQLQSAVHPV